MGDFIDSFLTKTQKTRQEIQQNYGHSNFIADGGIRELVEGHLDNIDKYIPKIMGVTFGVGSAIGAGAGSAGLAAIAGGAAGYAVGQRVGSWITGRLKTLVKGTLDESAEDDNSRYSDDES